ncbi:MAG: hypothetical protein U0R70_01850 [Solirubrobacteraceae bacterium]
MRPSTATKAAAASPEPPRRQAPPPAAGTELLGTALQAAGELAQLGISIGTRIVRDAAARIPKP